MGDLKNVPIQGENHARYESVRKVFAEYMNAGEEIGAAVSIIHRGETKVDLWGGHSDAARSIPWERDTLVCMLSVGKAIGSLCLLMLADRGRLDLDAPVAEYWPEFAQGGKEKITVRCLLSSLAGIPVAEAAQPGSLYDQPAALIRALEVQKPLWAPGTTPCYHSFTIGPLQCELFRRVAGKTLGSFLREEIARPLGIEFQFGLLPEEEERCAEIVPGENIPSLEGILRAKESMLYRAWSPLPRDESQEDGAIFNSSKWKQIEFPSGNGHGNAHSVAKLYAVLASGGELYGFRLLRKQTLEDAIVEQWDGIEKMTDRHFRYGTGFMLNNPAFYMGANPRNFGHPGLGGSVGFADPDRELAFSFCCNYLSPVADAGGFVTDLVKSMYQSVGG